MEEIIGILMVLLGILLIYLKIKKKFLVEEPRDDFYIPRCAKSPDFEQL